MAVRLNQRVKVIMAVGVVEDSVRHSNYNRFPKVAECLGFIRAGCLNATRGAARSKGRSPAKVV